MHHMYNKIYHAISELVLTSLSLSLLASFSFRYMEKKTLYALGRCLMDLPPAAYLLVLSYYRFGRVVCHTLHYTNTILNDVKRANGKNEIMITFFIK